MPDITRIRLDVIQHACSSKCMGHPGNNGGCCKLGPRDYIIGPVRDLDELLARLGQRFGRPVSRAEVVVEFEEGSARFPERTSWQNRAHFPALRVQREAPHACVFHDHQQGCTIHDIRPHLCRAYECTWLTDAIGTLF